jgi:hypothetical protein
VTPGVSPGRSGPCRHQVLVGRDTDESGLVGDDDELALVRPARLPQCRGSGAAPVNAVSFTPGCLLNARASGDVPLATREPRPGRGGAPLIYRNRVCEPLFRFLPRNQVPEGQEFPAVTGRSMYLAWTFAVPFVHLRCAWVCFSAGSGPCPAAARRWSANRFHLHAARAWGRLCLPRGRRFRPFPGGTALAALVHGGRAGCRCRVLARERCPRSSRGPGGGSAGTGKTRQPTGVRRPRAGRIPASPLSRPASACLAAGAEGRRPGFRGWGRERSAELADRLAGFANLVGTAPGWRMFGLLAAPLCGIAVVVVPVPGLTGV